MVAAAAQCEDPRAEAQKKVPVEYKEIFRTTLTQRGANSALYYEGREGDTLVLPSPLTLSVLPSPLSPLRLLTPGFPKVHTTVPTPSAE